jgi:TonB family protein
LDFNDKITPRRNLLVWTLVLSVVVHALFLLWRARQADFLKKEAVNQSPTIEIADLPKEILNPPKQPPAPKKPMEMAETEDAKNRKLDPNAKVLSDHTQSVEKQMRAKIVDDFRKKQGTGLNSNQAPDKQAMIPPTGEKAPSKSTEEIGDGTGDFPKPKSEVQNPGVKRDWKTLSLKDLSVGDGAPTAASDDRLSDFQTGDQTILSTREYKYFSYYNRIKELLRQYWKPNVEQKLYKMWEKGKNVGDNEMTTQLLVLLNDNGQIQKISRVGSCGFAELDEAAIEAFQRAAPFPNPPKGIIEADGFVRIRWDFILKTEAAPRIQFRNVGNAP